MTILSIETSCDETAAAVLNDGVLMSSIVYSQDELHEPFGGVVPELASRAHLQTLIPTIEKALGEAGVELSAIDGIAVTHGPGLVGALLVGVNMAKAMSLALGVPLLGVNHLEGHLFAIRLDHPQAEPPLIALLVSGGHTLLVLIEAWGSYQVLGQSLDDAAGEAFDKVAKMLGLGYPGGPAIDHLAQSGDPEFHRFPRSWLGPESLDFSFSGLKTAVLNTINALPETTVTAHLADLAASFQAAVVDVLVTKAIRAASRHKLDSIVLTGGVARNSQLRRHCESLSRDQGLTFFFPSPAYCTDNAAMIGLAGHHHLSRSGHSDLFLEAIPNLRLATTG